MAVPAIFTVEPTPFWVMTHEPPDVTGFELTGEVPAVVVPNWRSVGMAEPEEPILTVLLSEMVSVPVDPVPAKTPPFPGMPFEPKAIR